MTMDLIQRAARAGSRPPDSSLNVIEWGRRWVVVDDTSNWKGQNWQPDLTPYVWEPMLDYVNDDISDLTCMAGSQIAKTQPFLICLCWTIINDPSPTLWVSSTEPVLRLFSKARMWPTLKRCKPVAALLGEMPKSDQGVFNLFFPNMLLSLTSSEANAELQSTPYRRIILDEARKYKTANFNMVMKRTRTFTWNKMQVILSCPEETRDNVHQSFLNGDQREWEWECKGCRRRQQLYFRKKNEIGNIIGGLIYDTNKITKPGPDFNMTELMQTVRYKCIHCECEYRDEPEIRWHILNAAINRMGGWKAFNPLAVSTHHSYHWNALLPIWMPWAKVVEEFVEATKALRFSDIAKLREFVNETLGLPFEAREHYELSDAPATVGRYKMGDQWADEEYRFMTVDVQQKCFFVVIRAWSINGDSRLIFEGGGMPEDTTDDPSLVGVNPITSYDEVRDIQLRYRVLENNVAIDVSHWQTKIVRKICLYYNEAVDSTWIAFQGTGQKDFLHILDDGKRVRRIYGSESLLDAWIGSHGKEAEAQPPEYHPVPFVLFADEPAKDRLESERRSERWSVAANASRVYNRQIDGEAKIEVIDKRTQEKIWAWTAVGKYGNHFFDCEKMQVVLASMARIIGVERVERDKELSSREEKQTA